MFSIVSAATEIDNGIPQPCGVWQEYAQQCCDILASPKLTTWGRAMRCTATLRYSLCTQARLPCRRLEDEEHLAGCTERVHLHVRTAATAIVECVHVTGDCLGLGGRRGGCPHEAAATVLVGDLPGSGPILASHCKGKPAECKRHWTGPGCCAGFCRYRSLSQPALYCSDLGITPWGLIVTSLGPSPHCHRNSTMCNMHCAVPVTLQL